MKKFAVIGLASALCLSASALQAQDAVSVSELQKQLREMQQEMKALRQEVHELRGQDKLRSLTQGAVTPQGAAMSPAMSAAKVEELEAKVNALQDTQKQSWASKFNPSVGFVGEAIFGYRSKGNDKTGDERFGGADAFLRSAELSLSADVDAFAKAYGIFNASVGTDGEAALGLEEAAVVTTSLPWNLTARAGRFFAEFGRLAYRHDHELPFVLRPLAIEQFIAGESVTDGAELNWLLPTKQFISLTVGAGTQFGDLSSNPGTFRQLNKLNAWSRLGTYFDLTDHLSLELGFSGMINDRSADIGGMVVMPDGSTQTQRRRAIAGTDVTLRWHPLASNRHRGIEWGAEFFYNHAGFDFDPDGSLDPENPANQLALLDGAALPVTDALGNPVTTSVSGASGDEFRGYVSSRGFYTYLAGKLNRNWTVGFAFDWVQSPLNKQDETFRYSPYVTWKPSEFQQIRLQYSHTDRRDFYATQSDDHAVYLQWQFILGPHAHGFRNR